MVDTTDSFALNKFTKRWSKRYYRKNNFGVRDNVDYNYLIPPGKRRLTIIGDSFTAGHGIKKVDERFGNLLREQFPEIEIHILGINGFETIDELNRMSKILSEGYQLDIVLLGYCLNDITYLIPEAKEIYERMAEFDENLGFLARNSYFINTLAFRAMARKDSNVTNYYGFLKDKYQDQSWLQHKAVLLDLKKTVENSGGTLSVMTIPFLNNLNKYDFDQAHSTLDSFWRDEQVSHMDLLPLLKNESGSNLVVNQYDAHPNEEAHQLMANALNPFVKLQLQKTAQ
jgi:lysophospholipase L1-like esterase